MVDSALLNVVLVALLTDSEVLEGRVDLLRESYLGLGDHDLPTTHHQIYADTPAKGGVRACCGKNTSLSFTSVTSEFRLEQVFGRAFGEATKGKAAPDAHWFVFTDGSTWWHGEGLAAELARVEDVISPARPQQDVLLVGGGGVSARFPTTYALA